jgi:arylsulfatase A
MRPIVLLTLLVSLLTGTSIEAAPNIVLIFCDDLGYADLGCYGAKGYTTPHLDQMAKEGVRCTDFHVAAAVCSASRAAILTGCYPQRVSILGALGPTAKHGIAADEKLLPELLKERGYKTAIFGKWHLGHHPQFLPTRNGFDRYFGLPYSNDMWPKHPTNKSFPPLPLIDGEKTIEHDPDQTQLTTWYTERAVKFIEENQQEPFFVYLPHSMPHVPLFVSDKHKGKSEQGLFGDVIMEIDWSVGQILSTLKRLNLDDNTLVMFTSDNGPWLSYGNHAGSAGVFREGKGTVWEGGHRVPFIARYPGKIPAGQECHELMATMDILPTCVKLAGGEVPTERPIDGKDVWQVLSKPGSKTPRNILYYYWDNGLEAVRNGQYKLHLPHSYRSLQGTPGKDGQPGGYVPAKTGLALYDLKADPGEKENIAEKHPNLVAQITELAEAARKDLGDSLTMRPGPGRRSADKLRE